MLDQAVDLDDLPGVFPDAEARHLRDQRASWINAAAAQDLQASVPGQIAVFDPEGVDAQRHYLDLLWEEVFEDRGWRVETRYLIRIQELPNVLPCGRGGVGRIDMTEPDGRPHPGEILREGNELEVVDEVDIRLIRWPFPHGMP